MAKGSRAFDLPDPSLLGPSAEPAQEWKPSESAVGPVLEKNHDSLMALAGVTMIGVSQDAAGRPAIIIGVKTAKHLAGLPQSVEGVAVIAQVTGPITAQ